MSWRHLTRTGGRKGGLDVGSTRRGVGGGYWIGHGCKEEGKADVNRADDRDAERRTGSQPEDERGNARRSKEQRHLQDVVKGCTLC